MSAGWANRYELTLARDFVRAISTRLREGETGRLLFEVEGTDAASEARRRGKLRTALRQKMVLGLVAERDTRRPEGPAVAFRVRMSANEPRWS